jgi:endonuclease G
MKKFLLSIMLLASYQAGAEVLSVHCPLGCPSSPATNDLLFGHIYAASNNPESKFADWVAYEVNVTNFGSTPGRKWAADPLLAENETLEQGDYKGASKAIDIDRGHQAPLASFAGSRYWSEVNFLSNITPQSKTLNQGAWKNLEDAVRSASSYGNSLYVVTGPLFEREMPPLPNADETHKIPSAYFKIVYRSNSEAAAFIMDQATPRKAKYCDKLVELADVATRTNLKMPVLKESSKIVKAIGCP